MYSVHTIMYIGTSNWSDNSVCLCISDCWISSFVYAVSVLQHSCVAAKVRSSDENKYVQTFLLWGFNLLIYDQIHSRNLDTTWICKSIYLFLQTYVYIYLNITLNSSLPLSTVTDFIWFLTVNMDSTTRKYGIILSPNYDEKIREKVRKSV